MKCGCELAFCLFCFRPKDAIRAIKKKLNMSVGKNYTTVMYTLTVSKLLFSIVFHCIVLYCIALLRKKTSIYAVMCVPIQIWLNDMDARACIAVKVSLKLNWMLNVRYA